jgi:muramidase (phage lysozyme)
MARGNYAAVNRRSGASGAYQFTDDTWGGRYGVRSAAQATPEQQDRAAYETYQRRGTSPWRFSAACWRVSASRS